LGKSKKNTSIKGLWYSGIKNSGISNSKISMGFGN
jgi:hypothetical protein